MGPVIFTDLDDTLFQTSRKLPEAPGETKVMSYYEDRRPSGYATERQSRMLNWLDAERVVPVTARSREVLARVNISQAPAICSNGGSIITQAGEIDREWHARMTLLETRHERIDEVYPELTAQLNDADYRHWIVYEEELPLYIVIKTNLPEDRQLDPVEQQMREAKPYGWRLHRNGNNLAVLPPWLNKRSAVAHMLAKFREIDPHIPSIGIGDSHSDCGFMDLCDLAATPTSSQVWKLIQKGNEWCS
ncbi:sucrose-6-phosphate hydrolase [Croceicoccus marinus]|uniref:Sucrose-6-phosphate hydrolase n=1 Tax=Croceicoccus marinus TaxID=450378 RepID=A0A1Z1FAT1_9SPHN|nr:sucrose-6-phosphate hydrolase [Croceicoccus marinus]ARU15919.1 sucrose-6-phosphate hydrolase [Croceicoccus marinus]